MKRLYKWSLVVGICLGFVGSAGSIGIMAYTGDLRLPSMLGAGGGIAAMGINGGLLFYSHLR
mgnify:FL=1